MLCFTDTGVSMLKVFLVSFFLTVSATAQMAAKEFKASQLSVDYLSSDGSYWYDCTHEKAKQPHDWVVTCKDYKFNLHILLYEYIRTNETTFEFHYWADEITTIKETHTQSTWLTIDKEARTKKILGYLGFKGDSSQLRLQIDLK